MFNGAHKFTLQQNEQGIILLTYTVETFQILPNPADIRIASVSKSQRVSGSPTLRGSQSTIEHVLADGRRRCLGSWE